MTANLIIEVYRYFRELLADAAAQAYLLARGEMSLDELNSFYILFALTFAAIVYAMYYHRGQVFIARIIGRSQAFEEVAMQRHHIHNYGFACLGLIIVSITAIASVALLIMTNSS